LKANEDAEKTVTKKKIWRVRDMGELEGHEL
jgi:hypothetical protein